MYECDWCLVDFARSELKEVEEDGKTKSICVYCAETELSQLDAAEDTSSDDRLGEKMSSET